MTLNSLENILSILSFLKEADGVKTKAGNSTRRGIMIYFKVMAEWWIQYKIGSGITKTIWKEEGSGSETGQEQKRIK